jgi:predicted TIM-barrel fold metal-dependent hydrolase
MTPEAEPFGFSVENIVELCQSYPNLPVVIIRFNYENTRLAFRLLNRFPNLLLEISYYSTPRGIELLTRAFGAKRLLFGTGMPAINPGVALTLVRYANISDDEKRMIAGDNLRQLLKDVC